MEAVVGAAVVGPTVVVDSGAPESPSSPRTHGAFQPNDACRALYDKVLAGERVGAVVGHVDQG